MKHDEIMTVEEVAKYLRLKPQTVYKWAQQGDIPATKLGKEWRFRRKILDEWIDASIALSKGGFGLMQKEGQLHAQKHSLDEDAIDRILDDLDNE